MEIPNVTYCSFGGCLDVKLGLFIKRPHIESDEENVWTEAEGTDAL